MENKKIDKKELESFARRLLPAIEAYYESKDGKKAFELWKASKGKSPTSTLEKK